MEAILARPSVYENYEATLNGLPIEQREAIERYVTQLKSRIQSSYEDGLRNATHSCRHEMGS